MRATNLQTLTDQLEAEYSGITIYGIGDKAHQQESSDHNEDDTPGSKPEQSDADNNPEHRAIDVMLGPVFSKANAELLVSDLVLKDANKRRLKYVIWNAVIWRAATGFAEEKYNGTNKHTDHVHVSGLAANDEDGSAWDLGGSLPAPTPTPTPGVRDLQQGSKGDDVRHLQQFLRDVFPDYRRSVRVKRNQLLSVDGDFGPQTRAWVIEFQRRVGISQDGVVGPVTRSHLHSFGYKY